MKTEIVQALQLLERSPLTEENDVMGEIREKRWGNIHVHSIVVTLKTFTPGEFREGCGVKRTQGITTFNLLSIRVQGNEVQILTLDKRKL